MKQSALKSFSIVLAIVMLAMCCVVTASAVTDGAGTQTNATPTLGAEIVNATDLNGDIYKVRMERRQIAGGTPPYMEAATIPAKEWSLDHLVELYQNHEVWLRPDGYAVPYIFSDDGKHYAYVTDDATIYSEYRLGWITVDGQQVYNLNNREVRSVSIDSLVQMYRQGEWGGELIWSRDGGSAWLSDGGNVVLHEPGSRPDRYAWTRVFPAAGSRPVLKGLTVGDYTIVARDYDVAMYYRNGALVGAYRIDDPGSPYGDDVHILWSEDVLAEHSDYQPLVYVNGDFYRFDYRHGGATKLDGTWLTWRFDEPDSVINPVPGEWYLQIRSLVGDDLYEYALDGEQLLAKDCSVAEARKYCPSFSQQEWQSDACEILAGSCFDQDLAILLEQTESGSWKADVWTLAQEVLASDYVRAHS